MYLAPFNYNRFFERIFKKPEIAKRFFEDILDIEITEIAPFPRKTKLTVDAAYVEFDYRCKIDGQYAILDMQQWYKQDVVKRFYMYDANNTSLQMETLEPVSVLTAQGKEYKTRNYNQIEPTTTIVWMVDDVLGYKENIVSFSMTLDLLTDFIRNNDVWGANDLKTLLKLRAELLVMMDNDTKGMSFLGKNKLMFVFQKNIIKSLKMAKYIKWFKFAEATRNIDNVEQDFEQFKDDPIFKMMIEELIIANFDSVDSQYITDYVAHEKGVKAFEEMVQQSANEEAKKNADKEAKKTIERERKKYEWQIQENQNRIKLIEQEKQQAEQEKQQAEQEKQQIELRVQQMEKSALEKQLRLVQKCLKRGDTHEEVIELLEIEPSLLTHYITLLEKEEKEKQKK